MQVEGRVTIVSYEHLDIVVVLQFLTELLSVAV